MKHEKIALCLFTAIVYTGYVNKENVQYSVVWATLLKSNNTINDQEQIPLFI